MVETLAPFGSAFFCVTPPTPRALLASALADVLRETLGETGAGIPVVPCASFDEAAARARAQAAAQAANSAFAAAPVCIVATGSLYSIAGEKAALRAV